jgi:hypothetical protein
LLGVLHWSADTSGRCTVCDLVTPAARSRFSAYDSGALQHWLPRPAERDADHAERVLQEINRRQQEGEFGVIGTHLVCGDCAVGLACALNDDARMRAYASTVAVSARLGALVWMAFLALAEPGPDGFWKPIAVSSTGPFDPERVHRGVQREVERGELTPRGPGGVGVLPRA